MSIQHLQWVQDIIKHKLSTTKTVFNRNLKILNVWEKRDNYVKLNTSTCMLLLHKIKATGIYLAYVSVIWKKIIKSIIQDIWWYITMILIKKVKSYACLVGWSIGSSFPSSSRNLSGRKTQGSPQTFSSWWINHIFGNNWIMKNASLLVIKRLANC